MQAINSELTDHYGRDAKLSTFCFCSTSSLWMYALWSVRLVEKGNLHELSEYSLAGGMLVVRNSCYCARTGVDILTGTGAAYDANDCTGGDRSKFLARGSECGRRTGAICDGELLF